MLKLNRFFSFPFTHTVAPVQGTASSQLSAAIGVSVTVTFVVCFLIALVVIILLMKMWRRKHFDHQSAQSSSTQLTDLSRGGTPLKRMRSADTATTELTENGSIPEIQYDHERTSPTPPVPVINIEDVNSNARPNSAGSNHSSLHSLPLRKHKILPTIDWTPPRSITPMLIPRKRDSLSSDFIDSPRKSPEGSERDKTERSMSINSWFPAEEVQFNV